MSSPHEASLPLNPFVDPTRVSQLVEALEAPYAAAELSPVVKERIDKTIERYSLSKSLLELHVLSVGLCFGISERKDKKQ